MVKPAMQLAAKIPDVHVQLWASALLKGLKNILLTNVSKKTLKTHCISLPNPADFGWSSNF